MPIDQNDKDFVNDVADKLVTGLKPGGGKEDNDLILHLYDALWKNMQSKENRLWTFLSLYGAAVGLVFAGGQVSSVAGADLFAIVIVMALSNWAVLIILNANWWYYRNQLMVTRIENRYPNAVKGIVPKIYYENPNYRFDQLLRGSIMVLSLLLLLLYSKTMWAYHGPESINTLQALVVVVLLYTLFMLSAGYCLRLHESNIAAYYSTKKDILSDADEINSGAKLGLIESEIKNRKELNVRAHVFFLLFIVAGLFDFIVFINGVTSGWLLSIIIIQILIVLLFLLQTQVYRQPIKNCDLENTKTLVQNENAGIKAQVTHDLKSMKDKMKLKDNRNFFRRFCNSSRYISLLVLISGVLAITQIFNKSQRLQEDWKGVKTTSVTDVGEQINKVQQDFQSLQKSYNELQQNNVQIQNQILDEKLKSHPTREETNERFVTKEELNKLLDRRDKTQKNENK